jgi:hypothetical protein
MKKIVIIIVLLIGISLISCKDNAANRVKDENVTKANERDSKSVKGLPIMTFVSKEYNFGTIDQGDKVEAVFKFKNTGESDLIITKAKASCGCTVPKWPKNKAIKPGEESEITAIFDSTHKINNQNKSITLSVNTLSAREVVYIKGFVTPNERLASTNKKISKE